MERLTVLGDVRHIDAEAIQARLAPRVAEGFLAADLADLRHELESLPWVYSVNTRRRWPAEIQVTLVEQRPMAQWGELGYLNHEGQFFAASRDPLYDDLPVLSGPPGAEVSLMRRYQMLAGLFEPTGLTIDTLSLDALGQVAVQFDSGMSLLLGAREVSQRVARFRRLWEEVIARTGCGKSRSALRVRSGGDIQRCGAWRCGPRRTRGKGNGRWRHETNDCGARYRNLKSRGGCRGD